MDDAKKAKIKEMADVVEDALRIVKPDADFHYKHMFGGAGFYANGTIFAAWFGNELALKLSEADREALLQIENAQVAQSKQYIEVPPAFMESPQLLAEWVKRSLDYVG